MNKFLKYGLVAFTMANFACSSAEETASNEAGAGPDSSQIAQEKFQKAENTIKYLNELSVYSKYEQAADLSTYNINGQGMFTIIKGDSANADFEIALPNPGGYNALMALSAKGYQINEIVLEGIPFRNIDTPPKAFVAKLSHETKGDGKYEATNNFNTNKKELELYNKFGALFHMAQEGGDRSNGKEFPRYTKIENGNEGYRVTLEAGLQAAKEIATVNNKKIYSISRTNAAKHSQGTDPWAYVIQIK